MKSCGLQIVKKIRTNGELYLQDELEQQKVREMIDARLDEVMNNHGFKRKEE